MKLFGKHSQGVDAEKATKRETNRAASKTTNQDSIKKDSIKNGEGNLNNPYKVE